MDRVYIAGYGLLPGIYAVEFINNSDWDYFDSTEDGYDIAYNHETGEFAYIEGVL